MIVAVPRFVVLSFDNVIIAVIIFDILFSIYCLYSWHTDELLRLPIKGGSLNKFLGKYGFLIFALALEVIISIVVIGLYALRYNPILGW